MTDRELLELAAKAADMPVEWINLADADYDSGHEGMWLKGERSPDNSKFWNPLTNDGDAMRLAVKIAIQSGAGNGLNIFLHHDEVVVYGPGEGFLHKHLDDPFLATRRAIVRAAAAIGKAMP